MKFRISFFQHKDYPN